MNTNRSIWLTIVLVIATLFSGVWVSPTGAEAAVTYGVISDIHAGRERMRQTNNVDTVYPRQALADFQAAVNDLKGKVNFIIILGDNVNSQSSQNLQHQYAQKVKKIADSCGLPIVWVKGNHDRNVFGDISKQDYYYTDIQGQRIIVLDDVEQNGSTSGFIDDYQMAWFRKVIQENSIVVAHIPFLDKSLKVIPRYQEVVNLINQTHSIAYFGHWHVAWKKDNFEGIPALTNPKGGYFIRSFDGNLPNNIWTIPSKHSTHSKAQVM